MIKIFSRSSLILGISSLLIFSNPLLNGVDALTVNQVPSFSALTNPTPLKYSNTINSTLGFNSFFYKNRRFASYSFNGKKNELIRISLLGGLPSTRNPNIMMFGESPLVNPVLILMGPSGNIVSQKPDDQDVAGGLIRLHLPLTGQYLIIVTSGNYNTGGKYSLTLDRLKDDGSNSILH